jgi:hypothetical protein
MADSPKPIEADEYNKLPLINQANDILQSHPDVLQDVFNKIASLFREKDPSGHFTLSLVHHHYKLNQGERMVSDGHVTSPQKDTSGDPGVIESSWTLASRPYEWTRLTATDSAVPDVHQDLIDGINKELPKSVVGEDLRGVLGVTRAQPEQLPSEKVWWENLDDGKREHILKIIARENVPTDAIQTSWIPEPTHPGSMEFILACCGVCHHKAADNSAGKN